MTVKATKKEILKSVLKFGFIITGSEERYFINFGSQWYDAIEGQPFKSKEEAEEALIKWYNRE